jgi:hypothetical protein
MGTDRGTCSLAKMKTWKDYDERRLWASRLG